MELNGTDLYTAFQNYFAEQKTLFEQEADSKATEFDNYTDNLEQEYKASMAAFESQQQQIYNAWFQAMKDQLSKDAAGNLQNQCTELDERLTLLEQMTIQNNVGNKYSPTVIVASITSKAREKAKLPTHYYIDTGDDLKLPSIVLLEQLRTIDKRRLGNFIGHLSEKQTCGIDHALAVSIGLIKNVPQKLNLCLCSTCANNFYNPGIYYLRRVDPYQTAKGTCTYCNSRKGLDYEVVRK